MGWTPRRRIRAAVAVLAPALLLAACDSGGSSPAQSAAAASQQQDDQGGGGLLGVAQAELAARSWWNDDQQALAKRDLPSLAKLVSSPLADLIAHQATISEQTSRPMLAAVEQPTAVRVYVPQQQHFPLAFLAVFDVAAAKGGTEHVAELLVQPSQSARLVAVQTAVLAANEPAFDLDANGLVRPAAAAATTHAGTLAGDFEAYMNAVIAGKPAPATFAAGAYTSQAAQKDADFVAHAAQTSKGVLASVDSGYGGLELVSPVFALQGGGALALFATRHTEVLHAANGQELSQDSARHNWGVDVPPGAYPQISLQTLLMVAAELPAGGGPAVVLGEGGGVDQAG